MQQDSLPNFYLLLGTHFPSTPLVLADLLDGSNLDQSHNLILAPQNYPHNHLHLFQNFPHTHLHHYSISSSNILLDAPNLHSYQNTFILAPPHSPLQPFLASLYDSIKSLPINNFQVISFIDTLLASNNQSLAPLFQAYVHFSDSVFLCNLSKDSNPWTQSFTKNFQKQHFPCLFEPLHNNQAHNPALILDPTPRRISQIFDFDPDSPSPLNDDPYLQKDPEGNFLIQLPPIPHSS